MIRAIGIGDNVCDKYRHLRKMFPGGQALNFAVYCRQQGNKAAYIGVLGDDAVAKHVKHTLCKIGVDISRVRQYSGENGYAVIDLIKGERSFVTSNKGGVLRTNPLVLTEEDLSYISAFDIVHTSNNSYIDKELPKLSSLSVPISYDFSVAWRDTEKTKNICQYINFGFLSCGDLTEDEVKKQLAIMNQWGSELVIATLGSKGAIAYDGNMYYPFRPQKVKALDTLGAGDSLAAGFLMHYIGHRDSWTVKSFAAHQQLIMDALTAGGRLAAKTCMVQGAFGYGTELV